MITNKTISVLGATGSVGTQSADVAEQFGYKIDAISCARDIKKAEELIRKFSIRLCAIADQKAANELKIAVADTPCKVIGGDNAATIVAEETVCDILVNSIVGVAGLKPTVATLKSGKTLALANKESLVTGGEIVMKLAREKSKEILPIDSEHCAIWQSLRSGKKDEVKRLILTASGGPFFGYDHKKLATVTAAEALAHPTWNMGSKITIDSATLANKGFEVIEAAWLFDCDIDKVDVIVHRESIIHSMVEYNDGAIIAQLGAPDMRHCIQYAITYPTRERASCNTLDLTTLSKMTFFQPDIATFPLLTLARTAYKMGSAASVALNGSNEMGVKLFLEGKISLPRLFELVEDAVYAFKDEPCGTVDDILQTDKNVKEYTKNNSEK